MCGNHSLPTPDRMPHQSSMMTITPTSMVAQLTLPALPMTGDSLPSHFDSVNGIECEINNWVRVQLNMHVSIN